ALIVFLPLFRYSLEAPERFWYRSASRATEGVNGSVLEVFLLNVRNAALMFHVRGDEVWVNTLPYDPVLDRITGTFFLLGVGIVLWVALRRWRAVDLTFLLSLPILLLPSILALAWPRENPSVVRAGGALPIIMIMAALPLHAVLSSILGPVTTTRLLHSRIPTRLRHASHSVALLALPLLFAAVAYLNARVYFGPYAREYDRKSWNSSEVAQIILEHEEQIGGVEHAYVQSWPHWIDTRNVAFNLGYPCWNSVLFDTHYLINPYTLPSEPHMVILNPEDHKTLTLLEHFWSGATVERFDSRVPGKEFVVVIHPDYVAVNQGD
ncbi:MAG: hypothetical protein M3220_12215, partial [Chloroflexota bacterium]|nr:hypothetical protein [Chloroflexota bacterium]